MLKIANTVELIKCLLKPQPLNHVWINCEFNGK